jgi:hypothetical protein
MVKAYNQTLKYIYIMCKKNGYQKNPKPYRRSGKNRWAAHELPIPTPKTIIVSACCSLKDLFVRKQKPNGQVEQKCYPMM